MKLKNEIRVSLVINKDLFGDWYKKSRYDESLISSYPFLCVKHLKKYVKIPSNVTEIEIVASSKPNKNAYKLKACCEQENGVIRFNGFKESVYHHFYLFCKRALRVGKPYISIEY